MTTIAPDPPHLNDLIADLIEVRDKLQNSPNAVVRAVHMAPDHRGSVWIKTTFRPEVIICLPPP